MGTKMFKPGSFEEELARGMHERLIANQRENQFHYDQLTKAADFVNAAAEIFDETGFHQEAEVLTKLLEKMAQVKKPEIVEFKSLLKEPQKEKFDKDIIEFKSLLEPEKEEEIIELGPEDIEILESKATKKKA
jgi:hypothetical protein